MFTTPYFLVAAPNPRHPHSWLCSRPRHVRCYPDTCRGILAESLAWGRKVMGDDEQLRCRGTGDQFRAGAGRLRDILSSQV